MIERLSELAAVVSVIDPDAYATGTVNGDTIDMKNYEQLAFVLLVGTMAATSTLDYKIQGSAASDMSGAVDLTDKEIAQFTQAGGDSDKQAVITVSQDEATNQSVRYVRDVLTIATAASDAAAVALATTLYQPASNFDLASVEEIVN